MKKLRVAGILLGGLCLLFAASVPCQSAQAIDPSHAANLANQSPDQQVSVIVILKDQVDVKAVGGRNRAERQRNVSQTLQQKANGTQGRLRSLLAARQQQGRARAATPLWVLNAIAVTADSAVIDELAKLPEVRTIVPDATIPGPPAPAAATGSTPEPNLSLTNAPALWALGFQGQGIVVASMDTGVDYTHPDLSAQWRGGSNSWYDPYGQHPTIPTDRNGHGTSTMGVMVGRESGGTAIGVAPQASWIAVKIFNDTNVATSSAIHLGFQWLLDPDGDPSTADAPSVVNNSWSFSAPGCNLTFEPDLQALVAAGITPVFAAGNYGPDGSSDASPGNNPDAFAVGATDNADVVAAFSSRGPTTCGVTAPSTYPAVVAPGVDIWTTNLFGLYTSISGTSLAAPHVSGALALLLSAQPGLTVGEQRTALSAAAHDLGLSGPDNTYGAGRIDVMAAYSAIAAIGPVVSNVQLTPNPTNGSVPVTLSAEVSDVSTGGSNVTAAEYFIDTPGADGSGTAMTGGFGSPTASVSAVVSTTTLTTGNHTFYVHGLDATGSWGAAASAVLNLDKAGPATTAISLTPNPINNSVGVALQATGDDTSTGNSNVVAGELFIDDATCANGTGTALALNSAPAPTAGLSGTLPGPALAAGSHTVYVHSQDAANNWGACASAVLIVDTTGPATSGVAAAPNPTNGSPNVTLSATGNDAATGNSNIAAGEWFVGTDPGPGAGTAMAATDATFNSPAEGLTATINVAAWPAGSYTLAVRAKDAAGNWGATSSIVVVVQSDTIQPDVIFADGFESGDFAAWASAVNSGTRINVTPAARQTGQYGMAASISSGRSGYVVDATPSNEANYHARFYFNPNGIRMSNSNPLDIFVGLSTGNQNVFRVQLRRDGGRYQVRSVVTRGGGTSASRWYSISNGYRAIEIGWQSASSATFRLYIDGALKQTMSGLNTSTYLLDSVRLGVPASGIGAAASGAALFDSFASTRATYIGP